MLKLNVTASELSIAALPVQSLNATSANEHVAVDFSKRVYVVFAVPKSHSTPTTSLNPYYTVGSQIVEALRIHREDISDPWKEAVSLMDQVGIRDAAKRCRDYPHQMSGGMMQRIVIAMALACRPRVLVADEPTTALDVTIEAQIMALLQDLRTRLGMSILLITHNFGIVDGFADDVAVMFRGEIVEAGPASDVLAHPKHPYTQALIRCIPKMGVKRRLLPVVDYASF